MFHIGSILVQYCTNMAVLLGLHFLLLRLIVDIRVQHLITQ